MEAQLAYEAGLLLGLLREQGVRADAVRDAGRYTDIIEIEDPGDDLVRIAGSRPRWRIRVLPNSEPPF